MSPVFVTLVIDTVAIVLPPGVKVPPLSGTRETTDTETGAVEITGHYDNLFVKVNEDHSVFIQGSLPRFLTGSNLRMLRRQGVREAVEKLSGAFSADPSLAKVVRLDVAATVSLPRPVPCYYPVLGSASRFERVPYRGGVLYRHRTRSLTVYDKGRRAGVAGHLLRFEASFKKRVNPQFGRVVMLSDLHEPGFYEVYVRRWLREYRRISKVRRHVLTPPSGVRDLTWQLAAVGLHAIGGEPVVSDMVDVWEMRRGRRYSMKRRLRELAAGGTSETDDALIAELDGAIERAARLALAS